MGSIGLAELIVIGVIGLLAVGVPAAIVILVVVLVKRSKGPPR
jgi:hypothetical protein